MGFLFSRALVVRLVASSRSWRLAHQLSTRPGTTSPADSVNSEAWAPLSAFECHRWVLLSFVCKDYSPDWNNA